MLPDNWDRIQTIFLSLADKPLDERALLLDDACQNDTQLRVEVELLLASDSAGTQIISSAIGGEAALLVAEDTQIATGFGYQIWKAPS